MSPEFHSSHDSVEKTQALEPTSPLLADQPPEPLGELVDQEENRRQHSIRDKLLNTKAGRATVITLSSLAMGGALAPAVANAGENETPTGTHITHEDTNVRFKVGKASASAEDLAKGKVTILARVRAKGSPREIRQNPRCYVERDTFWNSGVGADGKRYWFEDDRDSRLCPDGHGGWVRVDCHNAARPNIKNRPPERRIIEGRVLVANSFRAKVKAVAKSNVAVRVVEECGEAFASAKASAAARIRLRKVVRARGSRALIRLSERAETRAFTKAEVKAEVDCQTSPPPPTTPPPPSHKNQPPTVDLVDHQHSDTENVVEVCAYGDDPDGKNDIVDQQMTESGDGNFISNIRPGDEPGEFCRDFATGNSAGRAVITAKVIDSAGNSASDTEDWEIVHRPF